MKTKQNESEFESEKKFRSIIESSPMGIHMYSLEADGKLIFTGANRAADKILGVDNSNFIGKTIEENFPPLAETEVPSRYREAALLGKNWQTEQIVYNDNKISGAFEVHAFQTSPGKMVTMFQDITERLKIESALKESEANLSSLINNKDESIWSIDSEYKYTTFNRFFREAYFEAFNIKLQKGFDALETLSPELREFWKSKYDKALSGERIVFEFTIEISKGKKYFEVFLNPIFSDGNVKGVSALSVDITERKLAELALHESEEKHRTLFETMTHGIVYQNADGNIISANPAAERILGLTLDQMQGRTSVDPRWKAIHEDGSNFQGDDHPSMVALKTGKQVRNVVMGVFNPSTEQHTWININAVPQFKPGQKNPFQVYTTFEDITTAKLAEKELRKSEARLALVFNSTSDLQVLMRVESIDKYIIITVNQSFVNSLKLISPEISFENIIGKERNEFLNSFSSIENTAKEITMFRKAVSSKEEIRYEFDFHFNVSKVSLDIKLTPVLDKRGNCTHLLWNARDITARKRAEETLERERRDYHSILDAAPVMLAYKNKDDRFVRVNSAFANFVGLPIEKIIGKTTFDLVKQPDVAKRGREHDLEVINTGNPVINQLVKWSGFQSQKEIWALYSKFPFKDAKGNIIGTVSFILDVNDRVLAEKALCESELKFRSVFENSVDAIGVSKKGIHVFVNPAYLKLFGYNQIDDLCGKPIFDLIAQSEHEKILSYVNKRANEEDVPIEYHSIGLRKDGSEFLMNVHVTGYKLNDEKYTVAIIRDITHTQKIQEELTASELKFKTLTEKAPVGIFSTDRFGSTTYVNPKWCEISKMDFDKALGDGWLDAVHPEDRKLLAQNWQNASSHHEISQAEYRFIHPDGSIAWVSGQAVPQKDLDGNVIGYFGTIIDITERKKAELQFINSEEKFHSAFHTSPIGITINRISDGKFLEVNDSFLKMFEFEHEEVINHTSLELNMLTEDERKKLIKQQIATGGLHNFELTFQTKSGRPIYTMFSSRPMDVKGERCHITTIIDITEKKLAEENLINTHEQYRRALKQIKAVPYLRYYNCDKYNYIGEEILDFTGFGQSEFSSSTWLLLRQEVIMLGECTGLTMDEAGKEFRKGSKIHWLADYKIKTRSGEVRWLNDTAVQIKDQRGNIIGSLGVLQDITERREAEEKIKKSREELRALSAYLQTVREEERKHLAREMHDEVGQILTSIKMNLALMKRASETKTRKSEINISEEIISMSKLVDSAVTSIRKIITELRPELLDKLGLISAIEWCLEDFGIKTKIKCKLENDFEELALEQNTELTIFRIIQESLTNISKHAKAKHVKIKIKKISKNIAVEISDDGKGITPQELKGEKSFGLLGMSERARLINAKFEIIGKEGKGTTVRLVIPDIHRT